MKHFVINFLAVLGVFFLVLIAAATYFYVTDPYELKPLLFGTSTSTSTKSTLEIEENNVFESQNETNSSAVSLELTEQQKEAVAAVGIDPELVPDTITAEQESCFVQMLGSERVTEIKAGAVPSVIEFARVKECL